MTLEQIEQARKCATPKECLAFIKENGIELSDEQLESISGGASFNDFTCWLGCHEYEQTGQTRQGLGGTEYEYCCTNCGAVQWYRRGEKPWYA